MICARVRFRAVDAGLACIMATTALAGAGIEQWPGNSNEVPVSRAVAHPLLWPKTHSQGLVYATTEARVTQLLAGMSLEEKVGQMIQADISTIKPAELREYPLGSILAGGNTPPLGGNDRAPASAWLATARAFRAVAMESRPGHTAIPLMFGIDAVHGNSNVVGATIFPHNVGLGATHDPALMLRIGAATAEETAAVGIDWAFGPTLATPQDERWGRAYEGYSADPAVVRSFAGPMVRGLQGEPGVSGALQQGHVAASAKHFLGDGGTTNGVDQGDTDVSEQELIRTHAQGYLSAIPAGVMTVMASYSSWQGRKMHGNDSLLTDVLKGQLGFEGFVVGDWNGHGQVPGCSSGDCPAAANAGLDMYMAPDSWRALYKATLAEARAGIISRARVDDAVRRILRVKFRLGLFDSARPWEGRLEVLGNAAHRDLARQAVRESLVLLKNNGALLPLRPTAKVLVAGAAADEVGRQCGGWTLSWQGTGNANTDFPNGQSIYGGLRSTLEAAGGSAEWSSDGSFKRHPDAAIVVFGELPYAEMQGDLKSSLEFQPGDKQDLALLRRLKAAGIPVVVVFLSGRPLWVNPEINAADAFVAAWYPGSEGGGIADVLIGDAAGKARYDFSGRLSYSWPKSAAQFRLNPGESPYDPLFALGYGLDYAHATELPRLSEESGVATTVWNIDRYFVSGQTPAPWAFAISPADGVAMRAVDAGGVQKAGRELRWAGKGSATLAISGAAVDLTRQANAELSLQLEYRLDEAPSAPVELLMSCEPACNEAVPLDLGSQWTAAAGGDWHTLKVRLGCFRDAAVNLGAVSAPFAIRTIGRLGLTLRSVRLVSDPAGALCLPQLHQ